MTILDNFQDVRGCVLDIKKFHSSISFNTPSDALISSLFIKYVDAAGVPLGLFDDLLALFHHADFRADGVTMHESEDIMDRIADQRRAVAGNRNGMISYDEESKTLSTSNRQSSTLIPNLFAEYVDSQRISFRESIQIDRQREDIFADSEGLDVENMLRTMSLVHRSWTDAVQRFLRRCITIFDYRTLRHVFQSPRIGPWVRKLSFHVLDAEAIYTHSGTKEMSRILCGILKRCPNITHLYMDELDLQADSLGNTSPPSQLDKTACDVLSQISYLKCLEHLDLSRIHTWHGDPRGFRKLCAILPCLPRLKSLSVERWTGGSGLIGGEVPKSVEEALNMLGLADTTSPSETLISLSLVDVDIIISSLLTRLTEPDRGGRVTKLKLSMHDLFRRHHRYCSDGGGLTAYLRRSFKTGMKYITYLQLIQDDTHSDPFDIELLPELFPSLQTLSLSQTLPGYSLPRKYFVLPNHIRNLHFHLFGVSEDEDPHALGILKANPHLRHMFITTYPRKSPNAWDLPPDPPSRPLFKDTIEFCERKKIEFVVSELCTRPHFPDF